MKPDSELDLRLLKQFVAVAECGGLSAAEQRLQLSRSTISTNLAELESRLGFCLCHRGRGGFSLTQEGKSVYAAATEWMQAGSHFQAQIETLKHDQLQGELVIAFSDDSLNHPDFHFAQVVAQFKQRAPQARLRVHSLNPQAIMAALQSGEAHIGIAPQAALTERFFCKPLYRELSQLYCSKQHPLFTKTTISETELGLADYVSAGYPWHQELTTLESKLTTLAMAPELEARTALILSGGYLGFLPVHVAQPWLEQQQLKAILPGRLQFNIAMAALCLEQQRNNKLLQHFFALLNDTHYVNAQKN
ncbi:LysR family transcriptional regulator [Simiduia curdlanivorans]|uniref:LysR family transcriptional regulator n=1 Tax=Simiduia curdlanivorans TaxID=1492769 RepID=A0ABV8V5D0_9GAMM|nr:LysR family transcriptional regulator [Simiduia curdlanivorans]MDN3640595.1 LysR family transcriptional regulator [Simiduia curdlanivorans]